MTLKRRPSLPIRMLVLWLCAAAYLLGATAIVGQAQARPPDMLQDTYYVVLQWNYAIRVSSEFAAFGAALFAYPWITRRMFRGSLAAIQFVLTFTGINLAMIALYYFVIFGPPKRLADYGSNFQLMNQFATTGIVLSTLGALTFVVMLVEPFVVGRRIAFSA